MLSIVSMVVSLNFTGVSLIIVSCVPVSSLKQKESRVSGHCRVGKIYPQMAGEAR